MSKDTIYREDAIKALIENVIFEFTEDEEWAITCLQNLPSADRPQGEWKKNRTYERIIICSECGEPFLTSNSEEFWAFCPNCGASMKGADDE